MQVEDVHAGGTQLLQRDVDLLAQVGGRVRRMRGVELGREREAAGLPLRFAREGFLFGADVDARGVDFRVALRLEVVEAGVVVGQRGYACAGRGLWKESLVRGL
jgi:hypothetical protein